MTMMTPYYRIEDDVIKHKILLKFEFEFLPIAGSYKVLP